jgi:hypothetical protein
LLEVAWQQGVAGTLALAMGLQARVGLARGHGRWGSWRLLHPLAAPDGPACISRVFSFCKRWPCFR